MGSFIVRRFSILFSLVYRPALAIVALVSLQACSGKFELSDVETEAPPATPLAPSLPTLSVNDVTANEADATLNFTVTLSAVSTKDVSVDYATTPGSATNGAVDYTGASGTLTIPTGSTTGTVSVTLNDDSLDEINETFNINLANPVEATILDGTGIATITDDDASPSLSINDVTAGESAGTLSFTVSLSAASGRDVTVNYSASGGTATASGVDYNLASGALTIPAGATSANILVTLNDDNLDEASETFNVVLASPVAASIADATGVGTITDNDAAPTLSINDMTLSEGAGTMSFTVTLSAVSGQDVTLDYAASGGTATGAGVDYSLIGGTLTILAGSTTGSIVATIVDDALSEASETFNVVLSNPTNSTISDATGVGTITDNESMPTLSINDVTAGESAGTLTFTVTLSAASGQNVTVDYAASGGTATSGGTDYTLVAGTATITAGTTTTSIVVTLNNDSLDEADETFNLTLSNPALATISDATGIGTITDDDNPPTVTFAADQNVSEPVNSSGNSNVTISVSLGTASGYTVTVPYTVTGTATGGGTDHNLADGNITVTAGATSGSVSFDLTDDALVEGSETVIVTMGSPTNATQGAKTSQTITISDNDVTLGAFSISGITGASDAVQDAYLNGGLTPIVTWSASSNATDYDVTIYENDGTTVKCSLQNTASTSYDFSSCSLTAGSSYKAHVTAKAFGASDVNASNSLFTFSVNRSPTITTSGPWYVLSGGSIIIDAQYAVAPAVGTAQDADGDTLTFSAVGSANSGIGTATNNSTSITYSPSTFTGVEYFTFTVSDGKGGTVSGTMTVHVVTAATWTGASSTAWSTAGNWCGAINTNKTGCTNAGPVPGSTTTAIFDDTCSTNCTAVIGANTTVGGVKMSAGGITQNSGFTLTVNNNGGWTQTGGTFTGGDSNITIYKNFLLSSGSFTSTSAILLLNVNGATSGSTIFTVAGAATFSHNNGTVQFYQASSNGYNAIVDVPTSLDFYNLNFSFGNVNNNLNYFTINTGDTLIVNNDFSMNSSGTGASHNPGYLNGGTVEVKGNLSATNKVYGGTTSLVLNGTGNQTFTSAPASYGYFPPVTINKASGTVSGSGTDGNFVTLNLVQGTLTAPTGTLLINPIGLASGSTIFSIASGTTFNHNNGTVQFYQASSNGYNAIVDVPTSLDFYNLNFSFGFVNNNLNYFTINTGDTLIANNDFSMTSSGTASGNNSGYLNGGTVEVKGNLSATNKFYGGSTLVSLSGTGAQTISMSATAKIPGSVVTINKPAGTVTQSSDVNVNLAGQSLDVVAGAYNMGSYSLTIANLLTLNSNTLTKSGGVLTVSGATAGTGPLFGGTVNP